MVFNRNADLRWILVPTWLHCGAVWAPKTRLGSVLGHLGGVLERLGASWAHVGASWGRLGASWERLGRVLGRLGLILGASWRRLGASEAKSVAAIILEASKIEKSLSKQWKTIIF